MSPAPAAPRSPPASNPRGEIEVDARGQTSLPGVFAAGDATTVPYKQIVIAAGDGAKAALSAFDYLIRLAPVELAEAAWLTRQAEGAGVPSARSGRQGPAITSGAAYPDVACLFADAACI
jgi:hypothetical protein